MANNYLIATAAGSTSWGAAGNWSGLAVPAASDTTTVAGSLAAIDTGLGQQAVTLAVLSVPLTFTGSCGLTAQTPQAITSITRSSTTATVTTPVNHGYTSGDSVVISGAVETAYNGTQSIIVTAPTTYTYTVSGSPSTPATGTPICRKHHALSIGASIFRYGDSGNGSSAATGSGRFIIDSGAVQMAATVLGTKGQGTDTNLEPVRLLGTHASNTLSMLSGLVGLATTLPNEVSTFATISIVGGTLNAGAGLTWTTMYQSGGTVNFNSGGTSFNQSSGVANLRGTGAITNATIASTTNLSLRAASGDTVTGTLWLMDGATLDLSQNPTAISVGTLRVSGEVSIKRNLANPGQFTWTTLTQDPGSVITFK